MKKWIYIALGILLVGIVYFWFFAKNTTPVTSTSDSVREAFVEGCMGEGGGSLFCNCACDEVVDGVGRDGLVDIGLRVIDEETTATDEKVIDEAMRACLK